MKQSPPGPKVTFFNSQGDLHRWLQRNHDRSNEVWIGFYKKASGKTGVTYREAVDEALCFGWIDGLTKRVDEDSYTIRFTPRRRGSHWSAVNMKRANELIKAGLMQPTGLKTFKERNKKSEQYSYERATVKLDPSYKKQFQENKRAWGFFDSQPPSYNRAATWWVMSAKKEETRRRRLNTLIQDSKEGRRLGLLTSPTKP